MGNARRRESAKIRTRREQELAGFLAVAKLDVEDFEILPPLPGWGRNLQNPIWQWLEINAVKVRRPNTFKLPPVYIFEVNEHWGLDRYVVYTERLFQHFCQRMREYNPGHRWLKTSREAILAYTRAPLF